jgi:hypoxanthine-DNA glycosylase
MAPAPPQLKSSFPPVADADARLLILGSLPGEVSLRRSQYYGHPQNQFWRLMAGVLGHALPEAYDARLAALRAAGVALWDVVRTARREGSLDARIRDHQPNPLRDFVTSLPQLRAVAFNGGTASAIGRRALGEQPGLALISLPSSSPAYTFAFEAKAAAWRPLRSFLES